MKHTSEKLVTIQRNGSLQATREMVSRRDLLNAVHSSNDFNQYVYDQGMDTNSLSETELLSEYEDHMSEKTDSLYRITDINGEGA